MSTAGLRPLSGYFRSPLYCVGRFYHMPVNVPTTPPNPLPPLAEFSSLGIHFVVLIDCGLSALCITRPAEHHVFLLIATRISAAPFCSLIHAALFLSVKATIFHSITHCMILCFFSIKVILEVLAP